MAPVVEIPNRLFVVCGKECTEDELKLVFDPFGKITSLSIAMDRCQRSRGFGFVDFEDTSSAAQAIKKLDGLRIGKSNHRLKVMVAQEQKRKSNSAAKIYLKTAQEFNAQTGDESLAQKRALSPTTDQASEVDDHKRYRNNDASGRKICKTKSKQSADIVRIDRKKVFITCSYKYTRQELDAMFRAYGAIHSVELVKSHGKVQTMAYIDYTDAETAASVVSAFADSCIHVTYAEERPDDPPTREPEPEKSFLSQRVKLETPLKVDPTAPVRSPDDCNTLVIRCSQNRVLGSVLEQLFSQCKGIDTIQMPLDPASFSNGVSMLKFRSNASAKEARQFLDYREVQDGSGVFVRAYFVDEDPVDDLDTVQNRFAHMMRDPRSQHHAQFESAPPFLQLGAFGYPEYYPPYPPNQCPPYMYGIPYHPNANYHNWTGPESNYEESIEEDQLKSTTVTTSHVKVRSTSWLLVSCEQMFDENILRGAFQVYGNIEDLLHEQDKNRAYIKFSDIDATIAALRNLSGATVNDQRLNLLVTEAPYGRRKRPRMDQASGKAKVDKK